VLKMVGRCRIVLDLGGRFFLLTGCTGVENGGKDASKQTALLERRKKRRTAPESHSATPPRKQVRNAASLVRTRRQRELYGPEKSEKDSGNVLELDENATS
jgi:hypothetical protein